MQFTAMPSIFPLFKISSPCLYLEILFLILLGSDIGSPAMVGGAEFFHDQSLSKIGIFFFFFNLEGLLASFSSSWVIFRRKYVPESLISFRITLDYFQDYFPFIPLWFINIHQIYFSFIVLIQHSLYEYTKPKRYFSFLNTQWW